HAHAALAKNGRTAASKTLQNISKKCSRKNKMKPRDTAGGIILNKEGKIVLVWQNRNSWAFPKGGIEEGETMLGAALREIKEETGLSASALTMIGQLPTYVRYSIGIDGTGEDMSRPASTRNLFLFLSQQVDLKPEDK